jgi:large subunit ribosomal protein L4
LIFKEGRLTVVDNIQLSEPKTKQMATVLANLKALGTTLVVDSGENQNLRLSIRNMDESRFLPPEGVNVYDLLRHDNLVVSRDAAKALEARCLERRS